LQVHLNMKIRLPALAICFACVLSFGLIRALAELEVSADVSIHYTTDFYEPLAPSGTWVEIGSYGRCWHPRVAEVGWRPYCNGYWELTDAGWYWVSDEPWAWACYHYGAWVDNPPMGWCWVPGVEWAPAWVNWRMGGDHIGWAPCGPPGFVVEPSFFVFVESRHFHDHFRPDTVIVNNVTIINSTTEIKNVRRENRQFDGKSQTVIVNEGPRVDVVEKASGHKFTAVSVREADRQTFVLVPEKLKHRTEPMQEQPKPVPNGNPEMPNRIPPKQEVPIERMIPPERTIPQTPPERIVPQANKELPLNKQPAHPKEIVPPPQTSAPVVPAETPIPNEKNQGTDKDKDHGSPP